jgi:hypothetical protein
MAERHDVYVDYLQTDDALPYPAPPKDTSEAAVRKQNNNIYNNEFSNYLEKNI